MEEQMKSKQEPRIAKVDSVSGAAFMNLVRNIDYRKNIKSLEIADLLAIQCSNLNTKYPQMTDKRKQDSLTMISTMAGDYLKRRGIK